MFQVLIAATSPAGCSTITSVKKSTLLTPFAFAYNLIFVTIEKPDN